MQLNQTRNRLSQAMSMLGEYAKRRPWLLLFVILLVVFTLIGSNSVVVANGEQAPSSAKPSPAATSNLAIRLPELYVHVVGEVIHPGLYVVANDGRVVDAVALAGGFTAKAEQSSVNLARVLTDGEQILVLRKGGGFGNGVIGSAGSANALGGIAKISLNRSSQSELESLPRVGPALASRIIDWRTANGGFKAIEDLLKVSGFGDKMFASVKGQVTL